MFVIRGALSRIIPLALAAVALTSPVRALEVNDKTVILPASPELCAQLDDPEKVRYMDGLLMNLAWSCNRHDLLGKTPEIITGSAEQGLAEAPDVQVNDDGGKGNTQSETAMAQSLFTGTLCSGFNDSCEALCPDGGGGFTGFSRSTDGGATWDDRGAVGATSFGDPSIVWRRSDGYFYFATLGSGGGLALWRSTDDCQTFEFLTAPATSGADKEFLAVDNDLDSPHYGNVYLVWTSGGIVASRSVDGGVTWSPPIVLGASPAQGAWPTVAPGGDVFVSWNSRSGGTISLPVVRSTDGGVTYDPVSNIITNEDPPRDAAATATCNRNALNGNIRYIALPQILVTDDGVLHAVYSYDPDGLDFGDVADVFYRRSTDNGASWEPEVRLHLDATTNDQYFPTLSANGNRLQATWYDRRLDPGNLLQDTFRRVSDDGGLTWGPDERISDVSTTIVFDSVTAPCYHGDYDQSLVKMDSGLVAQWSDDRVEAEVANVFVDVIQLGGVFADGFEGGDVAAWPRQVP